MGAKSTLNIGRGEAIKFILTHLLSVDNYTLEDIVESVNDKLYEDGDYAKSFGLHNFIIDGN